MIDVKIIAKAKSGDSASSSSTVVVQKSAVAEEATRAARADFADAANKAGYADLSGYADRAGTAEVAYGLTDDNIIKDQFLSKVIDDTAAGNITFSQDIAVTGDASIGGDVAVTGDVSADNVEANAADIDEIITESVKTATFDADPLVGVGFGIYVDTQLNNATKAVVDYLTVRKGMKVAVLELAEYRSVNGGLVLSPANGTIKRVTTAVTTGGTDYICDLKDDSNTFVVGDLVRCQRWDMSITPTDPLKYYWLEVTAVNQSSQSRNSITIFVPTGYSGMIPAADDVIVQMGNTDSVNHADRQGFVIITDDGMSVYNGVNSTSLTGKLKSKFGNLNNMTWHGRSLSGYGLLGDSVYLSGKFLLENTEGGTTTYVDIDSELGAISSSVRKVTNTLQNGGVNLARQTNLGVDGWGYYAKKSDNTVVSSNVTISAIGEGIAFSMWDSSFALGQQYFQFGAPFAKAIENGKKYTVSAEVFINSAEGNKDFSTRLLVGATTAYPRTGTSSNTQTISGTSGWQQVSFLIEADYSSQSTDKALFVRFNNLGQNSLVYFAIRNLKVEEGEVATTYTKAPEDTSDEFSEVRSEITQTAESITMSVVGSLVNNEEDTLYTNAVPPFTLNSSTRIWGGGNLFAIADYLPAGYYTIIMRANFGTAWTGFSLAVERFAYTSFTLATEEKGTVTTIKRTFFFEGLDSPSFKRVYIRMDGANVGDTNADADLQGVWLYAGDGVVGSLVRTGIDIDTGVITLQSNKVYFKNNAGDTPSILFDTTDGKILSKFIKAEELDTNHLIARDTNGFVIATVNVDYDSNTGKWLPTNDGAYRIYYPSSGSQNTAKKLELLDVNRGTPQDPYWTTLRMFESDGQTIAWELGTDAMVNGFVNPSQTITVIKLVTGISDDSAKTTTTFDGKNYRIKPDPVDTATGEIYDVVSTGYYYDIYYQAAKSPLETTYTRDRYNVTQDQQTGVYEYVKDTISWTESNITINPHNNPS